MSRISSSPMFPILACLLVSSAHAATRNVPADYATIQAALDASATGDIVVVAPGTYDENLVFGAAHDGVQLVSSGGPSVTVIDGGRRIGSVIRFVAVGSATRVQGFTITHGGDDPPVNTIGGGLSMSGASPTIEDNIIIDNHGAAAGGLYVDASSPTILRNVIRNNQAPFGSGGGIYCDHVSNPRIEQNVIAANTCAAFGGGVTIWEGSSPELVNNTIVSNDAALGGGGVYVVRNSHPAGSNNIVAWSGTGSGVVVVDASTFSLSCGDVFSNLPANYEGMPDPTGTAGNFSADPMFCNLTTLDLRISSFSPCAPANSPAGCSLIGALDIGCAATLAGKETWGQLKRRYR